MATRSNIGILNPNGSVTCIYCHWDGHLDTAGATLLKHYSTTERVQALLALGDLSVLGADLGEKHDFGSRQEGSCTAYHRDRGENWNQVAPLRINSIEQYALGHSGAEYVYLWTPDGWTFRKVNGPPELRPLTPEDCGIESAAELLSRPHEPIATFIGQVPNAFEPED